MNFMFSWQEHKIHIFSPPCNILYIHVGDERFTVHEVQAIVLITDKKYIAQGIGRFRVRI